MALDDYVEPEVAVAVAATAAVLSPRVRGWLRRSAVYAVAGALMAGDAVTSFARGAARGAQQAGASTMAAAQEAAGAATAGAEEATGQGSS
jgi:hypothetical protein